MVFVDDIRSGATADATIAPVDALPVQEDCASTHALARSARAHHNLQRASGLVTLIVPAQKAGTVMHGSTKHSIRV